MKFDNRIKITGTITKKDNFVNFIGFPVFGFEFENPKKLTDEELGIENVETHNSFRGIIFDNETFIDEVEIGDKILIDGEIQSRNFSQEHPLIEDEVQNAVDLYTNLFDDLPVVQEPTTYINQPIDWEKLFEFNLINSIPTDSAIDREQKKNITEHTPYIYKVDRNGIVTKESENTIYEIIVFSYEILNEEDDRNINEVTFLGRIATDPLLDIGEFGTSTRFTAQAYLNYFKNKEKRYAFLPFVAEGPLSESTFGDFKKNDFIKIKGVFNSKNTDKTLRLRKKTPSGKIRRKKVVINHLKRYISINEIEKQSN